MPAAEAKKPKDLPVSIQYYFAGEYNKCYTCPDSLYKKYTPGKTFTDFPASIYKGPKHSINYKSHPIAREYKTMITNGYKNDSINFAGHYVFVTWGCGSPCAGAAIVDAITGNVYEGPITAFGFSYRKDSYLLLVDSPDEKNYRVIFEDWTAEVEEYIWNETKKRFVETRL